MAKRYLDVSVVESTSAVALLPPKWRIRFLLRRIPGCRLFKGGDFSAEAENFSYAPFCHNRGSQTLIQIAFQGRDIRNDDVAAHVRDKLVLKQVTEHL